MTDDLELWDSTREEHVNLLERFRLDGKVAVVTGAGRGIGRGIALGLADAGADVVVTARDQQELETVAGLVRDRGRRAIAVPADITAPDAINLIIETALAELGAIDSWVGNAGGGDHPGTFAFAEFPEWHWDNQIALNLRPHFVAARALVEVMGPGSSIIGIASVGGVRPAPNLAAYGAAKAALIHLTKTLAVELGPMGIRVNAVSPGKVPTGATTLIAGYPVDEIAERAKTVPLRRLGTPQDVAAAVVYLASDAGSWVTGQNLVVSGGE